MEPFQDSINEILFMSKGERGNIGVFGYRRDYLNQILNQVEEKTLVCPSCKGVMREACVRNGAITCKSCRPGVTVERVNRITEIAGNLEIKCPLLRECTWKGKLSQAEGHLKECASFLLRCRLGCGAVVKRCDFIDHVENDCPLREVKCEFCPTTTLVQDMPVHLENCPFQPINCKCGKGTIRSGKSMHIKTECPLAEIECPYEKYSCDIGAIRREDLIAHKEKYYVIHQDMMREYFEKENTDLRMRIDQLSNSIRFKREMESFEWTIPLRSQIGISVRDECNLDEVEYEGSVFITGTSKFRCMLRVGQVIDVCISKLNSSLSMMADEDTHVTEFSLVVVSSGKKDMHIDTKAENCRVERKYKPIFTLVEKMYLPYVNTDMSIHVKVYYK